MIVVRCPRCGRLTLNWPAGPCQSPECRGGA